MTDWQVVEVIQQYDSKCVAGKTDAARDAALLQVVNALLMALHLTLALMRPSFLILLRERIAEREKMFCLLSPMSLTNPSALIA